MTSKVKCPGNFWHQNVQILFYVYLWENRFLENCHLLISQPYDPNFHPSVINFHNLGEKNFNHLYGKDQVLSLF